MRPRPLPRGAPRAAVSCPSRSEEHTSELQSLRHLVCRLLLEKKKTRQRAQITESSINIQQREQEKTTTCKRLDLTALSRNRKDINRHDKRQRAISRSDNALAR